MKRSTRCTRGEFPLGGREDAFDQRSERVPFEGKVLAHIETHTRRLATGAALGRNHAIGLELLAAEGVVALGIELGVG